MKCYSLLLLENHYSGKIVSFEVVNGGLVCLTEEMNDQNDECYIVNAAVYVGY